MTESGVANDLRSRAISAFLPGKEGKSYVAEASSLAVLGPKSQGLSA